ncbi:MAG: hypothetical protein Q4F79_00050 [Eubacteriales bacterium]|nr:hypothetical protein [Eubacteriales bacterium]
MNRQQKRAFVKKAQSKGISKNVAEAYLAIKEAGLDKVSLPKQFQEGDKVKLDVEKIMQRKDYEKMNPRYKEFVESNVDTVFTAHLERETLISLAEQPEWLFWSGSLIKVKENADAEENDAETEGKADSGD